MRRSLAKSVTGDDDDLDLEEAGDLAAEAKDRAIKATDAAKEAEQSVMKVSAGTVPADYTMLYFM